MELCSFNRLFLNGSMEKNDETLIRIVTSTFFCTIGRHCEDSGKGWTGNVHLGVYDLSRQADGYIAKQAKEARPFLERFGRSLLENFVEEALLTF